MHSKRNLYNIHNVSLTILSIELGLMFYGRGLLLFWYMRKRERKTSGRGLCWWVCNATHVIVLKNDSLANRILFLISSFRSLNYYKIIVEIKLSVLPQVPKRLIQRKDTLVKIQIFFFIIIIIPLAPTRYNWKLKSSGF